jgi:ferric-dicitrate binding protein FerR (iron transport regulator)
MTTPPSNEVILQYLAGTLHGEDADVVRRYLDATPARRGVVAGLRDAMAVEVLRRGAPEARASLAVVLRRIAVEEADRAESRAPLITHDRFIGRGRQGRKGFGPWALPQWRLWRNAIGAAMVVVFGVGLMRLVVTRHANDAAIERTYATAAGERAEVTLRDGTRAMLAPPSVLQVLQLDERERRLRVHGEVYFDVARSSGAPFVVRTGTIQTRVLGTAFLVRYKDGALGAHIAVAAGRVGVMPRAAREHPVSAGEIADVTDSTIQVTPINTATMRNTQTDAEFVFRDTPVSKILQTLTHWYGREFQCEDSALANITVNAAVSARSSAVALSVLEQVLNVNIVAHGDTITLVPQRRGPANARPVRSRTYDVWTPAREVGR